MEKQNLCPANEARESVEFGKLEYRSPELHEVGSSADLVQGGGGLSGLDRNYYYYYLPNE